MKTERVLLLGLLLLLLPWLAAASSRAEEGGAPGAEAAIATLDEATRPGADTTWQQRWDAYQQAKDALAPLEKDDPLRARYTELQPQVSVALRRDTIPQSGIVMGIVAALLLWGGFFFCLVVAMKKDPGAHVPLEDDETWPLRPE